MELPTYTNIWKIEKRLYKLYDFRLPMPLPVGQMAAFLAIAIPYTLLLTMIGMPFSHTWVWLYVLPPALLAWLVTRPVLEGKRLPELVLSQLRYLGEPKTWCRMAPLTEVDEIIVVARVWRAPAQLCPAAGAPAATAAAVVADAAVGQAAAGHADLLAAAGERAVPVAEAQPHGAGAPDPAARVPAAAPAADGAGALDPAAWVPAAAPAADGVAVPSAAASVVGPAAVTARQPALAEAAEPVRERVRARAGATSASASAAGTARPVVTVRTVSPASRPLHVVERALRASPGGPAGPPREQVVIVPGGHRPGKPDPVQRDQARARLSLPGPARIVVLGCTAGAGQTVTTLLAGQVLASLRGEPVAVLDLRPGSGSLTELATSIPRLLPGLPAAAADEQAGRTSSHGLSQERGLQVVTADSQDDRAADAAWLIDAVVARYPLTLADPAAGQVPRALHVADQLVLVAPASPDAANALAMTLEWLEAHNHRDLASGAVMVLNGVSARTAGYVDGAAAVATGRCRAIVRVPWDDQLPGHGPIGTAAVHAYTAIGGLVVAGLADPVMQRAGLVSGDGRRAEPDTRRGSSR